MDPPPDDPPDRGRVPLAFVAAVAMFGGAIAVRQATNPWPSLPVLGALAVVLAAGMPHAVSPRHPWLLRPWVASVMLLSGAALSNAFAFGGLNAVLALRAA